ncbi:hypothetical protein Tco_0150411 [Tanacetum coccineum]
MRTSKYGESNAIALDDPTLRAGNHVKKVLLNLNLPDHRHNILNCKTVLAEPENQESSRSNKDKDFHNSDIQDLPQKISRQRLLMEIVASFQDDAKYEHVGQDKRSQDGKDDKDLKISELKSKSKDNYKRLKIKDRKA